MQWHKTITCRQLFVAERGEVSSLSYNNTGLDMGGAARPAHVPLLVVHKPQARRVGALPARALRAARPPKHGVRARSAGGAGNRARRAGARPPSTRAVVPGANPGAAPARPRAPRPRARPQRLRGQGGAGGRRGEAGQGGRARPEASGGESLSGRAEFPGEAPQAVPSPPYGGAVRAQPGRLGARADGAVFRPGPRPPRCRRVLVFLVCLCFVSPAGEPPAGGRITVNQPGWLEQM